MTRNQVPPDVRDFVRREIKSVVQLEVLLLLHRTRERARGILELGQELGIDREIAETTLVDLEQLGVIRAAQTTPLSYQYGPTDPNLETMIEKLALSYASQRVAIFSLILSESHGRIHRFAEAFRLIRGAD